MVDSFRLIGVFLETLWLCVCVCISACLRSWVGLTALYAAVGGSHLDVVRQLIAAKARTHVVDAEGLTPLHEAANNGDPDLVRLLLAHGARVSHVAHSSGATVSVCIQLCWTSHGGLAGIASSAISCSMLTFGPEPNSSRCFVSRLCTWQPLEDPVQRLEWIGTKCWALGEVPQPEKFHLHTEHSRSSFTLTNKEVHPMPTRTMIKTPKVRKKCSSVFRRPTKCCPIPHAVLSTRTVTKHARVSTAPAYWQT